MWIDPGWFIHQLEVQFVFYPWLQDLQSFYLSFSTLYSSFLFIIIFLLLRTDAILFAKEAEGTEVAPLKCFRNK